MNGNPKIGEIWFMALSGKYVKIYDIETLQQWKKSTEVGEISQYTETRFIRIEILGTDRKDSHTQKAFLKHYEYRENGLNEYVIKDIIE
jgi:hypothetical protein